MPVILLKNTVFGTTSTALLVFIVAVFSLSQHQPVHGSIVLTYKEEQCLEKTGKMFEEAGSDLLKKRSEFQASMQVDVKSKEKMYATYLEKSVKGYELYCSNYGGKMHTIYLDFFDCFLVGNRAAGDIELTLKNFANCMADVEECKDFGQEHLLQEAWADMGLLCELEEEETKKDPSQDKGKGSDAANKIAKKEKEAAAKGANEADKEEKDAGYVPKEQAAYVPKEEMDGNGNPKKKNRFGKFLVVVTLFLVGGFVFRRKRQGLPIELPFELPSAVSRFLPAGGSAVSRFQRRPQTGFVTDYALLSAEENELQLSSNFA